MLHEAMDITKYTFISLILYSRKYGVSVAKSRRITISFHLCLPSNSVNKKTKTYLLRTHYCDIGHISTFYYELSRQLMNTFTIRFISELWKIFKKLRVVVEKNTFFFDS